MLRQVDVPYAIASLTAVEWIYTWSPATEVRLHGDCPAPGQAHRHHDRDKHALQRFPPNGAPHHMVFLQHQDANEGLPASCRPIKETDAESFTKPSQGYSFAKLSADPFQTDTS